MKTTKTILVAIALLFSLGLVHQTQSQISLKRDDFLSRKNWWHWDDSGVGDLPEVLSGYTKITLSNPSSTQGSNCSVGEREDECNWDSFTFKTRVKALTPLMPGSRGWGLWRPSGWTTGIEYDAWFMEQSDPGGDPDNTWWRIQVMNGTPETLTTKSLLGLVDQFEWHTYKIVKTPEKVDFLVDGELIFRVTSNIPEERMGFVDWKDNYVYYYEADGTFVFSPRGWTGTSSHIIEYVEIYEGELGRSEPPVGNILLRELPNEIGPGFAEYLWKEYTFDAPGGTVVIMSTARAETYINDVSDDDDMKIVVAGQDYGWDTPNSWNGDDLQGYSKTVVLERDLTPGSYSIQIYGDITPILYDVTVMGTADGRVLLHEDVDERASRNNEFLWKKYDFYSGAGEVSIAVSGAADDNNESDDDDIRIVLDGIDYGWDTEYAFDGDQLHSDAKMVVIRENLSQDWHTLYIYGDETPYLCSIVIYGSYDEPSIAVTSPNGGEDWQVDSQHDITWTSSGSSGNVDIEYSTDGGSSWQTIISSTPDDGSYTWTVPNTPSGNCLARVTDVDGEPSDVSDELFAISLAPYITVISPNGGEDWQVDSQHEIAWTSSETSGNVDIDHSTDGGSSWQTIVSSTPDDGSYTWTIPATPSTNCLLSITDKDGDPWDVSDGPFTITIVAMTGFQDSFEESEWNDLWVEDSQNDWSRSTQRATDGSYSAEVDGRATDATLAMAYPIELKPGATLTFSWFIETRWRSGEYIALDVYDGFGGWHELKRLRGNVDQEDVWHHETFDDELAPYIGDNFKIRFRAKVSSGWADGNVDNVIIESPSEPTPQITTVSLADGVIGEAYSATLEATGGTPLYKWSISAGSLPAGLSLDESTGEIYGTPEPEAEGTSFTVEVTDSADPGQSDTKDLSIRIAEVLSITTTDLANGQVGVAYSAMLGATGGIESYTWSISAGSLPAGLSLNPSTGGISGTPTTADTYGFSAKVTDSADPAQTDTRDLSIEVAPAPLTITTTSLPDGVVDEPYSATLEATGGTTPYTWSISAGSLPVGLILNEFTGVISGEPTEAETFDFTVEVRDSSEFAQQEDAQPLSITVTTAPSAPTAWIDIAMSEQSFWIWWRVTATVTITEGDASGGPAIEGATVEGHWSGVYSGNVSGTTNGDGKVSFRTGWSTASGQACFTVDRVVKGDEQEYSLDGETTDCTGAGTSGGESFVLAQNHPNPFNPDTWIPFAIGENCEVTIKIYDVTGKLVRTLDLGYLDAGVYLEKDRAAHWDGRNQSGDSVSSGVYFYVMEAGKFRAVKKMLVAR